ELGRDRLVAALGGADAVERIARHVARARERVAERGPRRNGAHQRRALVARYRAVAVEGVLDLLLFAAFFGRPGGDAAEAVVVVGVGFFSVAQSRRREQQGEGAHYRCEPQRGLSVGRVGCVQRWSPFSFVDWVFSAQELFEALPG